MILIFILFLTFCFSSIAEESVDCKFVNTFDGFVKLFWIDPNNGDKTLLGTLKPKDKYGVSSFPGHQFLAENADTGTKFGEFVVGDKKGNAPQIFTIVSENDKWKGNDAQCAFSKKNYLQKAFKKRCSMTPELKKLYEKYEIERKIAAQHRKGNENRRLQLNRDQPKVVPTFTETGFELTKVPDELWTKVQKFWKENRDYRIKENWDAGNSYVNHWEVAPTMAYLPQSLKEATFAAVKPLLEKWSGVELEPTACYGIRLYHRGNTLQNHVDRLDTHAISAIINVDQELEEEWPLHIYNHSDVLHRIFIKPKDLVMYESASRIHGRPEPFNGKYYANYFVHFRPKNNWVDIQI